MSDLSIPQRLRRWQSQGLHSEIQSFLGTYLISLHGRGDIDTWKAYVQYILDVDISKGRDAYSHALASIGWHPEAAILWQEYINLLQRNTQQTTYENQLRMDQIRRAYQQATEQPIENIETLWKAYDQFEMTLNKVTARKIIAERSQQYMLARAAAKTLKTKMEVIKQYQHLHDAENKDAEKDDNTKLLLQSWSSLMTWEKSNPLVLEEAQLVDRVYNMYTAALVSLKNCAQIWYDAYTYLAAKQSPRSTAFLTQAAEVLPQSLLIQFSYADILERSDTPTNARNVYEKLITTFKDPSETETKESPTETVVTSPTNKPSSPVTNSITQDRLSLIWVHFMRYARRIEGLHSVREIAKSARSSHKFWQLFDEQAQIEYQHGKSKDIAMRLFEVGFNKYGCHENAQFIERYIEFLIGINDETNLRALLERVLSLNDSVSNKEIWEKFLWLESRYGDQESMNRVLARRQALYPEEDFTLSTISAKYDVPELQLSTMEYFTGPKVVKAKAMNENETSHNHHTHHQHLKDEILSGSDDELDDGQQRTGKDILQRDAKLRAKFPQPDIRWYLKYVPDIETHVIQFPQSVEVDELERFVNGLPVPTEYHGQLLNIEALMDAILIMELPLDGHGGDTSLPDKVKLEDDAGPASKRQRV